MPVWRRLLINHGRWAWKAFCWIFLVVLTLQRVKADGWGQHGISWILSSVLGVILSVYLFGGWEDQARARVYIFAPTFVRACLIMSTWIFGHDNWYHSIDIKDILLWMVVGVVMECGGVPSPTVAFFTHCFILAIIDPDTVAAPVHASAIGAFCYWVFQIAQVIEIIYRGAKGWAMAGDF